MPPLRSCAAFPPFSDQITAETRVVTGGVNDHTSHQIQRMADELLPTALRDADGDADESDRTVRPEIPALSVQRPMLRR